MTGLVQTASEETRLRSSTPLIVSRDSFSPLDSLPLGRSITTLADVFIYFWYTFYHLISLCNNLWPLRLSWLLVLGLYKEDNLQSFKCVSFWLHGFLGKWEGWDPVNRFDHTSWVAFVAPADRPKSVRNRCEIEVFGGVVVLSRCFLNFLSV